MNVPVNCMGIYLKRCIDIVRLLVDHHRQLQCHRMHLFELHSIASTYSQNILTDRCRLSLLFLKFRSSNVDWGQIWPKSPYQSNIALVHKMGIHHRLHRQYQIQHYHCMTLGSRHTPYHRHENDSDTLHYPDVLNMIKIPFFGDWIPKWYYLKGFLTHAVVHRK